MPSTTCLQCATRGRPSTRWTATGRVVLSRRGRPRAIVACATCGRTFESGWPDALEAAQAAGAVLEVPVRAADVAVPAPSLFGAQPKRDQGFVDVGELARRRIAADKRRRATEARG